ncbi:MAG: hypothetical protein HY708_00750, partial [Ignavibacteriae bacterium]|nr:hypothetical protein [Ignavibacteriota bacterium]
MISKTVLVPPASSAVVVVAIILLSVLSSPSPQVAFAGPNYILATNDPSALHTSTVNCAALGGAWSNATLTCPLNTIGLAQGSSISVDPGATLAIANGGTISGLLSNLGGTVTVGGVLSVTSTGNLSNSALNSQCGTVTISGTVTNAGVISSGCTFTNAGTITNNAKAFIYDVGGTFTNKGTINNLKGGAIQDDNVGVAGTAGTFVNSGTINNGGWLQLYSGQTVTFTGPSSFSGTFTNTGTLNMNSG